MAGLGMCRCLSLSLLVVIRVFVLHITFSLILFFSCYLFLPFVGRVSLT